MHEAAAMQGAVHTILAQMRAAGGSRVTTVELMLGASGHFTEEAVRQHFVVLTTGTPAEGAVLEICWVPATFQCFSCLHRFESCEPAAYVTCPQCADLALEIEHHDACYVSAIDVACDGEERGEGFPGLPPSTCAS